MTYKELREKHNWNLPEFCPRCKQDSLKVLDNGIIKCSNPLCNSKKSHQLSKLFSAFNVKGAGEVMINKMSDIGVDIFEVIADAKFLDKNKNDIISKWNLWANSINGEKIISSLSKEVKNPISLSNFLSIFDYDGLDQKKLKVFDKYTILEFTNLKYNNIIEEKGFADISAKKICSFIKEQKDNILKLSSFFEFKILNTKEVENVPSFCFTGKLSLPRKEFQAMVTEKNWIVKDTVSSGLTYLVSAEINSESSKFKKAEKLGTKIISEKNFFDILKTN